MYGATELGSLSKAFDWEAPEGTVPAKTLQDWEWMQFSDLTHPLMDPQGDGTFELKFQVSATERIVSYCFSSHDHADLRDTPARCRESP